VAENRTAALISRNDGSWLSAVIRMCDSPLPHPRRQKTPLQATRSGDARNTSTNAQAGA